MALPLARRRFEHPVGVHAFREVSAVMFRFLEVSIGVASCIVVAMTACEGRSPRTVSEVESFIREKLPVGTDRSRVVQVLNEAGIENSGMQAGSGVVHAIIRDTSGGLVIKGSITMKFFFDDRGKLARYEVRETFTGP
jgi:hypothetical protein